MSKKIKWKKVAGTLYLSSQKKTIDARQGPKTFYAYPEEIPETFRDTVIPQEPLDPDSITKSESKFEVQHKGAGWYNVVEITSGKPVNDKSLRQAQAEQLLKEVS